MYDAGGINIKPGDAMHLLMKHDMAGAGADPGRDVGAWPALDCPTTVTGYLMCTDNMPSGSAMKMGDVLRMQGGKTVEVQNTDAEGRLVMADALVLATENDQPDAIVDIATLTGAALRALGPRMAAVIGNDQALVDQVVGAAAAHGRARLAVAAGTLLSRPAELGNCRHREHGWRRTPGRSPPRCSWRSSSLAGPGRTSISRAR